MPIDRTQELHNYNKRGNRNSYKKFSPNTSDRSFDIEMGVIGDNSQDLFFKEIEGIRASITKITRYTDDLKRLHTQALTTLYADDGARANRDIEELTIRITEISNSVRRKLKKIGAENEQMANNVSKGNANLRIRTNQVAQLSKKFMDVMRNYQQVQTENKQKHIQQLERQYKIVRPDATQEELEKLREQQGSSLMSQQIFTITNVDDARELLDDMQERHNEIMVLEKSMLELHQLFMDISLLIDQQGDMINTIESQVEQATEYTSNAVVQLKSAVEHQKSVRKKKWYLLIFFLIILAIGGVLLWFYVIQPFLNQRNSQSSNIKTGQNTIVNN
ncbi:Syntaxin/epimorphin domain-containing protein [Rozella allomycis CSF55]|uniref:Syntaxin/epimorphin domain-containing protein n=1 Tax=Rozella allomycis (strain CSF55) TaxID=988480 RepID=A0A075ASX4_ROZAC|nr:Syntaxin/epimorphin domain-containing protein [Rozella allomycis CSF55]|eukprot:EPZ31583.1 Syntaxin/epimorphin domain-containing protein [Rozella allomycis CSF55]